MCIPLTAETVPRACVAALRQVNARVTGAAPAAHKGYERETMHQNQMRPPRNSVHRKNTGGGSRHPKVSVVRAVLSTAEEVEKERRIALLAALQQHHHVAGFTPRLHSF